MHHRDGQRMQKKKKKKCRNKIPIIKHPRWLKSISRLCPYKGNPKAGTISIPNALSCTSPNSNISVLQHILILSLPAKNILFLLPSPPILRDDRGSLLPNGINGRLRMCTDVQRHDTGVAHP